MRGCRRTLSPHHGLVVCRERPGHSSYTRHTARVPGIGAPQLLPPHEDCDGCAARHLLLQALRRPHGSVALEEALLDGLLYVALLVLRPLEDVSVEIVGRVGRHFGASVSVKYSKVPDRGQKLKKERKMCLGIGI